MPLEGTLSYMDIAHLLQVVGRSRKSGVLEITHGERSARLVFQEGRLIRAESNQAHAGLGELLVEEGVISASDLERALEIQSREGDPRRLGAILCDEFGVSAEDIQRVLARQFRQIVFDVFRWPGGTFRFEFGDPGGVMDRFHLNPSEFILDVGIQAGFLAREGMAREYGDDPECPTVVVACSRPDLADACAAHWRQKGCQVRVCHPPERVEALIREWPLEQPSPWVIYEVPEEPGDADLDVLGRLRAQRPGLAVVAVGVSSSPLVRARVVESGADVYVRAPSPSNLAGDSRDAYMDVFLLQVDKAMQQAALHAAPACAAG